MTWFVPFPSTEQVENLAPVFEDFKQVNFPSIGEQFDSNFVQRYDEFWEREKLAANQKKLFPVLDKPVQPARPGIDFDLAICDALGVKILKEDLIGLYGILFRK